ncbi:hypothetical protein H920_13182 [Fukomys damarensis]|uniref:Uncharacterized protein n=1 Tax=Fukomys damarensis TaxID=885580 RepID=A0A091DRI1_FUKDA|nr:hypothetical protein H920_13182 [Fukomys damarensis]
MAAVPFRKALVFALSVTSWLQCRSLDLVAQTLHPTNAGFLVSTTGLWVFLVQILDRDLHGTLPWALGLWLDSSGTSPWDQSLTSPSAVPQLDSLHPYHVDRSLTLFSIRLFE